MTGGPSPSIQERLNQITQKERPKKTPEKSHRRMVDKILSESDSPKGFAIRNRNVDEFSNESGSIIEEELMMNEPDSYYQQKIMKLTK